jgi:tetraacyldisaccharide 4'-kinase
MHSVQGLRWQNMLTRSWTHKTLLSCILWPVSWLLGVWVRVRASLYRNALLKSERIGVPVIVVGNVVAGGAGKTPVVMAIASHLVAQGFKPGIVSRGYGRRSRACLEVMGDSSALDVGDEPALLKRTLGLPVFVAARRADAAHALLIHHPGTDVIVSDDGLQHLALKRDIEVCVFDDRGVGNGFLLPAGPLREPWPRSVDLIIHTGEHPAFAGFRARRRLQTRVYRSDGSAVDLTALTAMGSPPILAVAAIAQPARFFAMLQADGLVLAGSIALPDHDDFSHWERPNDKNHLLICTEKDAIKLWVHHPDALAARLDCQIEAGFMQALDERLAIALKEKLSSSHGHTIT